MRVEEALWFYNVFREYSKEELSPCINIGSSTKRFRETVKPHIERYVLSPLRERGIQVINFDLKKASGVDISGDIFDNEVFLTLKEIKPSSLICSNILEHVADRSLFAERCASLLRKDGLIFITVPYSYPYHPDLIDTLYRPKPEDIAKLFSGFIVEKKEIIIDSTYLDDLKKMKMPLLLRRFFRLLFPFYKPKGWLSHWHRILWLFRAYKVSCAVLRKKR